MSTTIPVYQIGYEHPVYHIDAGTNTGIQQQIVFNTTTSTATGYINRIWYQCESTEGTSPSNAVITFDGTAWVNANTQTYQLRFGYLGQSPIPNLEGPFRFKDYAPLDEWIESNPDEVKAWLKKMVDSPTYLRDQLLAHDYHDLTLLIEDRGGRSDIRGQKLMDILDSKEAARIQRLRKIVKKLYPVAGEEYRIVVAAITQRIKELKQVQKAHKTSMKLLKKWLTKEEYAALVEQGELHVKSKTKDNTIYIVKKNPEQMVEVIENGKQKCKLCLVAKDNSMPYGDRLLSKVMLLKTDEEMFWQVANKH